MTPETPEAPPLPALTRATRALGLLAGEGASVGLGIWTLRARERLPAYVASNALPPHARKFVIGDVLGGAALAGLAGVAVLIARRRAAGLDAVERGARRLAPLSLAALIPLLFYWQLWTSGREITFVAIVAVFGLALQALTRVALDTPPVLPARARAALADRWRAAAARLHRLPWLPTAIVVAGVLAYAIYFSIITIQKHYRLETSGYDLGIENNLVWNAAHFNRPLFKTSVIGGPESTHIGFHETYISYLLGIPYRLAPWPETLLALQATLIGGAALPLYLFGRRHVGAWTACLVALLCLFYAPMHGSNLYDFHYLPFAPFFLWSTLWLLEARRDGWATVAVILTLANREDMSALLVFVGAYLLLTGERPRAGLVVTIVSGVYFVAIKLMLMPHFLNGYSAYVNQYQDLLPEGDNGFGGVLKTVFGNIGFTVGTLLDHDKLVYILQIMTPLAFFPWRRPIGLLCTLPGFLFTMLATRYLPLVQIWFQYTAYWTSFLFIAVVANLAWLRRRERAGAAWARTSRRAWLVAMAACVLVNSYQFGIVFQQNTAWGGFSPFHIGISREDRRHHDDVYSLIRQIPPTASVAASETLVAQISSRKNAYTLRIGVYDADYILVRMPCGGDDRAHLIEALQSRQYGVVGEKGEFVLLRRGADPATADDVLHRLGA